VRLLFETPARTIVRPSRGDHRIRTDHSHLAGEGLEIGRLGDRQPDVISLRVAEGRNDVAARPVHETEEICARPADQDIVALVAGEVVSPVAAHDEVVALAAQNGIVAEVALAAGDGVVAEVPEHQVVPLVAVQDVIPLTAADNVCARPAEMLSAPVLPCRTSLFSPAIRVAPAYDFVSTIAYIPDDKAALKVSRSKFWTDFDREEIATLARKAGLPETIVLDTASQTVAAFREVWTRERANLPVSKDVAEVVENQLKIIPLAQG